MPNFSSFWRFYFFGPNLLKNGISARKQKKRTSPLRSTYSNSLGTKFQLKQFWFFWTKFARKGYFWLKMNKVNITIEFCIFELALHTKFARKGYFRLKTEKVNTATKLCIFELVYKPNFTLNNFEFWGQICPKRAFPVENGKSEHHHWNLPFRFSLGVTF